MAVSELVGGSDDHARGVRAMRARRARRVVAALVLTTTTSGVAMVGASIDAAAAPSLQTPPSPDGTTAADAAASCWEIKQLHPASGDGVYWLRTETLVRPEQFYCDMTTDGGGWVLIGRGREGWTFRDYGQLTPESVRSTITGPGAFSPGALSTDMINALLDGGHVRDLADGVRLRRAANTGGTQWQELRWRFLDLTTWSWAMGGGHRLASFEIDGSGGTGSNTKDSDTRMPGEVGSGNRNQNGLGRWFTFPWSSHGGLAGFAYGGSVDGQNNATSYLWERTTENHALPFTQVFIRPQVSTPALPAIPDGGLPAVTVPPLLDDRPAELAGGVAGVLKVGDSEPALDTPVLAITTFGDRVFVGGKFAQVRNTATGQLVSHPYLAAFDRSTGAWISSFDPDLDGTVWDLDVVNGRLIVAGQFTNVDGVALTAGLAALDPVSGAVDPAWRASLSVSGTSARPYARAIDVEGSWIYVGGNFTGIQSQSSFQAEARLGRVAVSDGSADTSFRPNVDGVPYDIDAAGGRVYVVGDFDEINGNGRNGVGIVDANDGSVVGGLQAPVWSTGNVSRQYQQAVLAVGSEVWQGGSEHNLHAYRGSDYGLEKAYITSGRGGDFQAIAEVGGVVYGGSHGNSWIYEDAIPWPALDGYTRTDDYKWIGAFDAATRDYHETWVPSLDSGNTEGAWAMHVDADDCLWFGGDFVGGPYVNGQRQYLEGFSRFCQLDVQAPTVPATAGATPLTGGGVQIDWSASTDNGPGFIGYEVLRNDRVVSPLVYGAAYVDPTGVVSDRYFVRAVDAAGNRSATTAVLSPGDDTSPPSTPQNLTAVVLADSSVDLSWTASTDDTGVDHYLVFRNGVELLQVPGADTSVNLPGLGAGSHWFQARAVDAAGNESFKTPPVRVDIAGPDVQSPSVPGDPAATFDPGTELVTFSWSASVDDTGVEGYRVRRNLTEIADVDGSTLSVDLDLAPGGHYLQVEAYDAAGNTSFRTAPVFIEVTTGGDSTPPSTPTDLAATVLPNGTIDVTWSASTDNVGVDAYEVLRNLVAVATVPGAQTSVNVDLGPGSHWIQVRAFDAAGNASFRTPPVNVVVSGADTSAPTTPQNLTAVAQPDGSVLVSWTASTDDVGVTGYRILRNLAEVMVVPGTETTATVVGLGPGAHWIQVQALDAAGNASFRTPPVQVNL